MSSHERIRQFPVGTKGKQKVGDTGKTRATERILQLPLEKDRKREYDNENNAVESEMK